uniref:Nectin cell adhesion molecule 3 n=1 Tax=Mus spicilegus TaxID=10103 RepID=A0A8C6N124_MUSSI
MSSFQHPWERVTDGRLCRQPTTEHLPLQTQFKEIGAGGLQPSNGPISRRFDYEDESTMQEDGTQRMCPLYSQMCHQDRSPRQHHPRNPERLYINPREHYV